MKRLLLFLLSIPLTHAKILPPQIVDFHTSMGKDHHLYAHYYTIATESIEAQQVLAQLEALYTKNIPAHTTSKSSIKIPKKIHQIWLGSPLPEKFKAYTQSWQLHHPDWEYRLWIDTDIAQLTLENQALYDQAINYAERSDIARYEILYQFGGLYVDTDFECVQSMDDFHYAYDFYTGLELPGMALFLQPIIIPNGLIGCIPKHSIMRSCIDGIKKNSNNSSNIVIKTGPLLFTQAVLNNIDHGNTTDIVLPASYFYPIDKQVSDRNKIKSLFQPETYAVHHWAGSWILKEEAFVPGIKIRSVVTGNTIKFTIVDDRGH